jgi:hypothetical protein
MNGHIPIMRKTLPSAVYANVCRSAITAIKPNRLVNVNVRHKYYWGMDIRFEGQIEWLGVMITQRAVAIYQHSGADDVTLKYMTQLANVNAERHDNAPKTPADDNHFVTSLSPYCCCPRSVA